MNERELFLSALEIEDSEARQAHLQSVCADDAEMLARVEALLASHESQSQFLNTPAVEQIVDDSAEECDTTILVGNSSTKDEESDAEDFSSDNDETMIENQDNSDEEIPLGYLLPSTKPDSLGRLAHYEIIEVIGRGAFGIVLKAFDEKLHRVVAIKVLSPEMAATSPARKRFLREARSSAAIRHENVVAIYAVDEQPIPYLVMEYIPGKTLQQRLDGAGPLDVIDVLRLGKQIAEGLAAAHAQDLIHRDIKPANILLDESVNEHVKITDFGLARTADDASMTQSGLIAGTPMYMAPEQALGNKLDQRADLFSLGSVLYQMVSGRPPFRAPSTVAVLKRVADDTPRPIQEIIPETPDWLCDLIGHLHAKDPADRYVSADKVAEVLGKSLAAVEAGQTPLDVLPAKFASDESTTETPSVRKSSHFSSNRLAQAAIIGIACLVFLGITEATGVTQLASTVIRLTTGSGTLVIETDDPSITVSIDGEEVTIKGAGVEELTLRPGEYKIAAMKDGQAFKQELVSITRNGRSVVRMSLESSEMVANSATELVEAFPRANLELASGEPIDLIDLLDPARDFLDSRLKVENGKLITPKYSGKGSPGAIGMIPFGSVPTEYDIELQLQRVSNQFAGFNFGLVVGGRQVAVGMDCGYNPKVWGLDYLDGLQAHKPENPTHNPGRRLIVGEISDVTIQVRKNHVTAICDGETLIDWTGDPARLSPWSGLKLPTSDSLFLVAQADFIVHKMALIPRRVKKDQPAEATTGNFSLSFDGKDDFVETPVLLDVRQPFTLEAVITLPSIPKEPTFVVADLQLGGVGFGPTPSGKLQTSLNSGTNGRASLDGYKSLESVEDIRLNEPTHVAATFDGEVLTLFVDGKMQPDQQKFDKTFGSPLPLMLGGNPEDDDPPNGLFTGMMREVRISETVRYTEDFQPNSRHNPDEQTLALYHFDEGIGDVLKDSSGNGRHGKIVGAKWIRRGGSNFNDSPVQSPSSFPPGSSADILTSDEYEWTEPELVIFEGDEQPRDSGVPLLSFDGQRLYFSPWNSASASRDIFVSERTSDGQSWGTPKALNGPVNNVRVWDSSPALTNDETIIVFTSDRSGGFGERDLWMARRSTRNEPFGEPVNLGPEVNSSQEDNDPKLSGDGLTLVYHSNGKSKSHNLWMCQRDSVDDPFGTPQRLGDRGLGPRNEKHAFLSADSNVLLSYEEGSGLRMRTRPLLEKPFGPAIKFPAPLNHPSDQSPCLSADSSTLYFSSRRDVAGISGKLNLWMSRRVKKSKPTEAAQPKPNQWPVDAPSPAIAPFDAEQAQAHQEAWAKHLGVPVEYENSIGMKFRLIPPGEFLMGSTPEEIEAVLKVEGVDKNWRERIQRDALQRKVMLTQPLYVGATTITQAQYEQVMGTNPSHFSASGSGQDAVADLETGNHPVEMVSWNDAAEFCAKLSEQEQLKPFYSPSGEAVTPLEGTGYRLPTEAEWEFACRAGTTSRFWSGDQDSDLERAGWFGSNSEGRTYAAGELNSNSFGLSEMHGNVWEWVQDSWDPTLDGTFTENPAIDPSTPFSAGSQRVLRGGHWGDTPLRCRSSARCTFHPTAVSYGIGFRVVLVPAKSPVSRP